MTSGTRYGFSGLIFPPRSLLARLTALGPKPSLQDFAYSLETFICAAREFCHLAVACRDATACLKSIPNRVREVLNHHDAAGGILLVEAMDFDPLVDQYLRKLVSNPFQFGGIDFECPQHLAVRMFQERF